MAKSINVGKIQPFDSAEYLANKGEAAAYLTVVLEDRDSSLLVAALEDVARAQGTARDASVSLEELYSVLRTEGEPGFHEISRVFAALGFRLVAIPI